MEEEKKKKKRGKEREKKSRNEGKHQVHMDVKVFPYHFSIPDRRTKGEEGGKEK